MALIDVDAQAALQTGASVAPGPRNFPDLRAFLACLEARGWLQRIRVPVSADLEISEIADRVTKHGGPALLFEHVVGAEMPLLINTFGTRERMALALGVQDLDDIAARLAPLLKPEVPATWWERLKALPKLKALADVAPQLVRDGPCKEVRRTTGPFLRGLPVLKCWPEDAGRFITFPMVITRHPETGARNVGCYRMQVLDDATTLMHWQRHKDGRAHFASAQAGRRRMDVAVALGADPASMYAATAPLPEGMDEFLLAGFIRREPVKLVKCETVDLEVPAAAELVLEGYVDPDDLRTEGPFGDHTGFYSLPTRYPAFHIRCVTHRRHPIYPTIIVGRPPMEDDWLGKATERIFLPMIRLVVPELVDLHLPFEGVFHNCAIVSIRKTYPGQAKKVMQAIWGMGQLMFSKIVIVVEEPCNVQDLREVAWRVFNSLDPKRDILFSEGPVDELDVAASHWFYGSKMGIDATRKGPEEGMQREWPAEIRMTPVVQALVSQRWSEYGLPAG